MIISVVENKLNISWCRLNPYAYMSPLKIHAYCIYLPIPSINSWIIIITYNFVILIIYLIEYPSVFVVCTLH